MNKCTIWMGVATIALTIIILELFYLIVFSAGQLDLMEKRLTSIEQTLSEWGLDE